MQAPTSLRSTRLALLASLLGGLAITSTIAPSAAYARHSPSHRVVLHLGSHGPRVARVQRLLHVPADGVFGPQTLAAVVRFQHRHRLRVDGQVGRHTLRRLRHAPRHRHHHAGVLHVGSHGRRVMRMQRLLHVAADGVFGPATLAAVVRFQRRHGLVADGQVGAHTLRRLHHARRHRHHRHRGGVLRIGSHGRRVLRMQRLLHVPADGVFGPQTLAAVLRFQRRHHLRADGQVGRRTMRRLRHARHHHHARRHRSSGVLHRGSHGPRVARMQRLLHIAADGIFGPQTLAAVLRFQGRHQLAADGRVGRLTWRRLLHAPRHHHRTHHRRHHRHRAHGVAARAIRAARSMLGVPYAWGGSSPGTGFDCSGLVMYAFGRAGVALPHFTVAQYHAGRHVGLRNLRPGDLVFFEHLNHVGIWLGHGRFIHAPHSGTRVQITALSSWYRAHWSGATRIA